MRTYKEYVEELMAPIMAGKKAMYVAITGDVSQRLAGLESKIFYNDVTANIELGALGAEYFGQLPKLTWDVYNCEVRSLGQGVTYGKFGLPDVVNTPFIKGEEDFDKLHWPTSNPLDCEPYAKVIEGNAMLEKLTGMPTTFFSALASVFSIAVEFTGFANVVGMIKKQPDVAKEYMRRIVDDVQTPLIKAIAEKYPGIAMKFADAWERIPNISPKVQREFVFPYYDRILENTKDFGISLSWAMTYGEGSMPDPEAYLLEKLPYTLNSLTNTNTEGLDPEFYRQVAIKHNLSLSEHVPAAVLQDSTPEELIEFMRALAKRGVGVKSFSNFAMVPATIPIQNLDAVIAAQNAFAILPYPESPEVFDKIKVEVPKRTVSFKEFCEEKAKTNPYGFDFGWLKHCNFIA